MNRSSGSGENSELSLQKELNARGGESQHRTMFQSERAAQAKAQSSDDSECLSPNARILV